MKILAQWAKRTPGDWEEIDSADWFAKAKKPLPPSAGTRIPASALDNAAGWINALNVQGVIYTGYDHYAVSDLPDGAIKVTAWKDDPAYYTAADLFAIETIFRPLAPDPEMGDAINTNQSTVVYTGAKSREWFDAVGPLNKTEIKDYADFVKPSAGKIRHGIYIEDAHFEAHRSSLSKKSWRDWGKEWIRCWPLRSGKRNCN